MVLRIKLGSWRELDEHATLPPTLTSDLGFYSMFSVSNLKLLPHSGLIFRGRGQNTSDI